MPPLMFVWVLNPPLLIALSILDKSDKVFKSGLSKSFKGRLPQNLLSPLLNTLSQIIK